MTTTQRSNIRKGPHESATAFSIGTVKKGNDGNMWKIIVTKTGIHRWSIIKDKDAAITMTHATKKNKTVKKHSVNIQPSKKDISLSELKKLAKKNNVLSSGKSKSQLALLIFKIRSQSMSTSDLEKIVELLPSKEKRKIKQMISNQYENPVTEYKGMWKPLPKSVDKMSRIELIHNLRNFRDAWEREVGRNQDLSDERLEEETDKVLRQHLSWYYSETSKNIAANFIRGNI
jgi:hypothetical protein